MKLYLQFLPQCRAWWIMGATPGAVIGTKLYGPFDNDEARLAAAVHGVPA